MSKRAASGLGIRATSSIVIAALALLSGCAVGTTPRDDARAGVDATARRDTGSVLDTPDVTPTGTDVTQSRDDSAQPPVDAPRPIDAPPPVDAGITCPMPPPAYVVQAGRCVPSCLAAGGTTCSASSCAGRMLFEAWDCAACCVPAPSTCGSVPSNWVCTADGRGRQRCNAGTLATESCAGSCAPGTGTADATCAAVMSTCTGSSSGNSPIWTCTADRRSRQRCVMSVVQTEACANGCAENVVGTDDTCAPAPTGCSASASGTSSIWTCTADRTSRQRCVSSAVQTEACPSGCTVQPLGTDDFCAASGPGCTGSASGTSSIWTCTSDLSRRQRCVSGAVQTETCAYGCGARPTGTDDVCNPMPMPGTGTVSCAYPQWWNLPFSWDPGYYAVSYGVDNDLRMAAGGAVQLRHGSRLLSEGVYGWGWMPEFQDMDTGRRFRFLHLQTGRRLTRTIGMVYPAGTLVGYSGGNTADTGYPTYSSGAHLCVQTQVAYRTAFPTGTDTCR